jgi:hypothetical protein
MNVPFFSVGELTQFKCELSNENRLIAEQVAALLPRPSGGIILDIGAGLGDIAAMAFPDRDALLIDILDFGESSNPRHQRRRLDFFDYDAPSHPRVDVALMSHVLQYLDSQPDRLSAKLREIDAPTLIIVTNDPNPIFQELSDWFADRAIAENGEAPIKGFPPEPYRPLASGILSGTLRCASFAQLSHQLGRLIYDAPISPSEIAQLAVWLDERLAAPVLEIPQTVTLYGKT